MSTARAELIGGPEDGKEITIAADADGLPMTRVFFPSRLGRHAHLEPGELPPLLAYDRGEQQPGGRWTYQYAGTEPVTGHDGK